MPFTKGKSKTGGRKKGIPNAITHDLREVIRELIEGNVERIRQDLEMLDPKERVNAWLKLTEFVLPKLQRSEVDATINTESVEAKTWVIEIPAINRESNVGPAGGRGG